MVKIMYLWLLCILLSLSFPVSAHPKILAFSGSVRADSANKKLAIEALSIAQDLGAEITYVDLKDYSLPFYDADLELNEGMPENAKKLRQLMFAHNIILISSPDYNHSVSAILKNTIDWSSRSETGSSSREAYKDKTFVLMSASPGAGGGAKGLPHLRSIIESIGGKVNGKVFQEEFSLPDAYNAFDEKGHLKEPQRKTQLKALLEKVIHP